MSYKYLKAELIETITLNTLEWIVESNVLSTEKNIDTTKPKFGVSLMQVLGMSLCFKLSRDFYQTCVNTVCKVEES